jgi:prepilin-type N-terminal cleavage/methylation domain-containing protein
LLTRGAQKRCQLAWGEPLSSLMRRAFTLPELMLVLALVGILLGIALPRLSSALDRIEVHTAANRLVAAHNRARMLAVSQGHVVVLSVDQHALILRRPGETTALWSEPGPEASGVSLSGPGVTFTFSPEGLTLGLSNATLKLARGSATRTVVVSRLGRVRVTS